MALLVAIGLPRLARSVLPDPLPPLPPATIQPRGKDGPQGMRVGTATLNATAEAGAGYDSNLFAQGRRNAVGDAFRTEALRARLDTDWRRDALSLEATVTDIGYASRHANNTTDYSVAAAGRWDATRELAFAGSYRHLRGHLSVSDPSAQALGVLLPVPFDTDEARASATWTVGGLTVKGEAAAASLRFGSAGGTSLASSNRDQAGIGVAAAYAFTPGNAVTLAASTDAIRQESRASRVYDGQAWQVVAGGSWTSDAVWRARASLGYLYRSFEGGGIKPLQGLAAEALLTWIPTRTTAVTLSARRGLDDLVRADPIPNIRNLVSLLLQHEATRELTLTGELRLERLELSQPRRRIEDAAAAIGLEWRFGRHLALLASYERSTRLGGYPGLPDFDRDFLSLRLRGGL
ncbi:outer membrane beta-barrel protein [Pararoseomonas sp. SCSIO 73927]|uniref:outer membrane beta-barrel protein n=1 Tax=Pararoseomonas sp. SCSIO 73927 TaxID=3114537 RepID=UPI0030CEB89E